MAVEFKDLPLQTQSELDSQSDTVNYAIEILMRDPSKANDTQDRRLALLALRSILKIPELPQRDLAINNTTLATPTTYAVRATTTAITPRSSSSKFWLDAKGIAGSINIDGGLTGARGDARFQRKIGTGSWANVSGGEKLYAFLANFGNPPWEWGPIEDAPTTNSPVQYRIQIKRASTGAHSGLWNSEFLALTVIEVL